jgi:CheY-like chemotaxis protein
VDDDNAVREVAVRALARAGYRVIAAADGEAALALLAEQESGEPIVMLTDVLMQGMNGPELADRVAQRFPSVVSAFMSGFSADELAKTGVGPSTRILLNKPFTLPELVAFVEQAFAREEEIVDA